MSKSDDIALYIKAQKKEYYLICDLLREEINAALPKATSKVWHGHPVWFLDENPIVGFSITAKKGVNLLFWSGQSFDEPLLQASGKFKAAQIFFNTVDEIDADLIRRWLKKATKNIWNYKDIIKNKGVLTKLPK